MTKLGGPALGLRSHMLTIPAEVKGSGLRVGGLGFRVWEHLGSGLPVAVPSPSV